MASTPPSSSSDAKRPSSGAAAAAETASEATKLKDAATAKYKEKDYAAAVKLYSEAILLTPTTQLYTNRAAAHMMLEQCVALITTLYCFQLGGITVAAAFGLSGQTLAGCDTLCGVDFVRWVIQIRGGAGRLRDCDWPGQLKY